MKKIDGKNIAAQKLLAVQEDIEECGLEPALAAILIGDDAPSHLYVKLKQKAAKEVGIELRTYIFPSHISRDDIATSITFLNQDPDTHGIIVQLPLPDHLDADDIVGLIDPNKDVDGFHRENQEKFMSDHSAIYPVFPGAIMALIESCHVTLAQQKAVVLGRSDVFDRVMTHALEHAGVKTQFIACAHTGVLSHAQKDIINQSDIIVTACGVPGILSCDIVHDGAIIIDGGISKVAGKTVGDVDMVSCNGRDVTISPVPGGVGPVTIACLLENVVALTKKQSI